MSVWNIGFDEYTGEGKQIAFEQYKLLVDMANKISERRTHANNFFLTLNSSLIVVFGFAVKADSGLQDTVLVWLIPIIGIIICFLWHEIIRSYRNLNAVKFRIIHEIEERLPLAVFKYEWSCFTDSTLGAKYIPTSHIEMLVPSLFVICYTMLCAIKALSLT